MPKIFDRLDDKKVRELRVLSDFSSIFCRENHRAEVKDTFPIKDDRLRNSLSDCETHCYAPSYRERTREVMRFSGLYLVKHGWLDLVVHYFL